MTRNYGRLLGAITDHPVINGVGWDVIISAIRIGSCATVRAIDIWDILSSVVPLSKRQTHNNANQALVSNPKADGKNAIAGDQQGPRRRERSRKAKQEFSEATYEPNLTEATKLEVGDDLGQGFKTGNQRLRFGA